MPVPVPLPSEQLRALPTDAHLREEQERRWRAAHADFIAAHNETVEVEGLPLDEWRAF